MTQTHKLESYKQHMLAKGVGETTSFPPVWRMFWALGIKLPPPPFLGFISLTLFTGGFFGPVFGLGAWFLGNRGVREMAVNEALWVALATGTVFGLLMAAYYRHLAHRHRLGSWSAFSASGRRT